MYNIFVKLHVKIFWLDVDQCSKDKIINVMSRMM